MLIIYIKTTNVGKTPAYKVRKLVTFGYKEIDSKTFKELQSKMPHTEKVLGSNREEFAPSTFNVVTPNVFYIAITLIYNDIWGEAHYTHGYWRYGDGRVITMYTYNDSN